MPSYRSIKVPQIAKLRVELALASASRNIVLTSFIAEATADASLVSASAVFHPPDYSTAFPSNLNFLRIH